MSSTLRVLTYHRIAPSNRLVTNISADPDAFAAQAAFLAENYHVTSMEEVLRSVQGGRELSSRTVLITFDDAYRDLSEVAWPILKRYKLPATVFVPTAYPSDPNRVFWWDRLKATIMTTARVQIDVSGNILSLRSEGDRYRAYMTVLRRTENMPHDEGLELVERVCQQCGDTPALPGAILTWDELRRLSREGLAIGGHTRTHPILTKISKERVQQEMVECRHDLEREIENPVPVFAYPAGRCNKYIEKVVADAGFILGFTTAEGHNDLASANRFLLHRTSINPRTSISVFRLRLLHSVSYLDAFRYWYNSRARTWAAAAL